MPRKRRVSQPKPRAPKAPAPRKPRPPDVPATHSRATVAGAAGRSRALPASSSGPHAAAGAPVAALELAAPASAANSSGLADTLLEIVGADHATLRSALAAWQREQDRVANRTWRRPGGLSRPAGL